MEWLTYETGSAVFTIAVGIGWAVSSIIDAIRAKPEKDSAV